VDEFFGRLKERKLVQWGLAYAAAAFALLQGVDIVAQRFGWPESIERGLIVVLAIGGGLLWRMSKVPPNVAATDSAKPVATLSIAIPDKSIAVLPLVDESGEKISNIFPMGCRRT